MKRVRARSEACGSRRLTRYGVQEYGSARLVDEAVCLLARGGQSHVKTALSRFANRSGYFFLPRGRRRSIAHFQWQAASAAPLSPPSRVRSLNLSAHHGEGDGRIYSYAQRDAFLRLSRSCPERRHRQRVHCRPLRTCHYALVISLHAGHATALSKLPDLGALPCAFGTCGAPFLPAAARERSQAILRTAPAFPCFRSRILPGQVSDFAGDWRLGFCGIGMYVLGWWDGFVAWVGGPACALVIC